MLRSQYFPDVTDDQVWERRTKTGFATIPRSLPIIMVLMDELSPKKPISTAYLALWCRAWDDPLINVGPKLLEIAMDAGFTGQRAQNSLCARLAILKELGFVRFAPGPGGQYANALLLNPYLVLKKHKEKISKLNWNTLLGRMSEIGADDFHPPAAPADPAPEPAPPAAVVPPAEPPVREPNGRGIDLAAGRSHARNLATPRSRRGLG